MATNSEARKRVIEQRNAALFSEPQWRSDEQVCCEHHARVLRAARRVWGDADLIDASALADALEDEGIG